MINEDDRCFGQGGATSNSSCTPFDPLGEKLRGVTVSIWSLNRVTKRLWSVFVGVSKEWCLWQQTCNVGTTDN